MKRIFLLTNLVALLFTASVFALSDQYGTTITATYCNIDGLMLIKIPQYNGWLAIGLASDPIAKSMFAIALSAKNAGSSDCWIRWDDSIKISGFSKVWVVSQGY